MGLPERRRRAPSARGPAPSAGPEVPASDPAPSSDAVHIDARGGARQQGAAPHAFRPHGPVDAYEHDPRLVGEDDRAALLSTHRFPRFRLVRAVAGVGFAFLIGWLVGFYGTIPGIFRAADVGMPVLFLATLRFLAKLAHERVPEQQVAAANALIPSTAAYAAAASSFILFVLTVPQLAVGILFGTLGYAAYSTRLQTRRLGQAEPYGVLVAPTVLVLGAEGLWLLMRSFLGAMPGFSVTSAALGFAVAAFALRQGDQRLRALAAEAPSPPAPETETAAQRDAEKRAVVGIILSYLVFRFFLSAFIPYGPIVEWVLISIGILFFGIIAGNRLGVVPTREALPRPEVRRHVQFVASLPDQRLAESTKLLDDFIEHGIGQRELVARLAEIHDALDVPAERRDALDALGAHRQGQRRRTPTGSLGGRDLRRVLVHEVLDALQEPLVGRNGGRAEAGASTRRARTGDEDAASLAHGASRATATAGPARGAAATSQDEAVDGAALRALLRRGDGDASASGTTSSPRSS